ncbi:uncharacterized protein LOC132874928 isoform X1 [Neoarius graeffei]|uniref:uncharacterized protein LOC132874928 isoform X1 n=1 Tax=Neoarius graeffei TaxID=443677 RepID=UPI00298C5819|nr:uncharacterized protein LOC132874928 isoform X1 [Neoarius graeffei]
MRIFQLHVYLLVCCGAAEGFIEKSVDLGQSVTLKCAVTGSDVFWFLMKPSEPPVYILRSYSRLSLRADYSNTTFSKTFSLQYNSSLFIHNISTNELGVYYCIQSGSPPDISSGIRLYIQNHSAENQSVSTPGETWKTFVPILTILVIMNLALAVTVTVFTVRHCRRSPKAPAQAPDPGLQLCQDASLVYTQVQYVLMKGCIRTTELNSTRSCSP